MQIKNVTLDIVCGDITNMEVSALVIPGDGSLTMTRGLAAKVKKKGGGEIEGAARRFAPCPSGESRVTLAGTMAVGHIIHTVAGQDGKMDEVLFRRAFASALTAAENAAAESVALPDLREGTTGFSLIGSAKIAAQEILRFARWQARAVKRVVLCFSDEKAFAVVQQQVFGYVDHIQNCLGLGPYVTVDVLIERPEGLVVIERSNPPYGLALPGGFVDYGESLETAARREAKEETHLDLVDLRQMHTFSDPSRDPRFHTVTTVFIARGEGVAQSGDDAQGLKIIPYAELLAQTYAFDHKNIIEEYLTRYR